MLKGGRISFRLDDETIKLPFPAGVKDGHKIKVRGKGRPMPNGSRGDLYVTIRIDDLEGVTREGSVLHQDIDVSVFDALLGASLTIKTPAEKSLKLAIPPGSQQGEKLRVRGHGIETASGTGDLIVHLNIKIPAELTDEQKKLIQQARDAG